MLLMNTALKFFVLPLRTVWNKNQFVCYVFCRKLKRPIAALIRFSYAVPTRSVNVLLHMEGPTSSTTGVHSSNSNISSFGLKIPSLNTHST